LGDAFSMMDGYKSAAKIAYVTAEIVQALSDLPQIPL